MLGNATISQSPWDKSAAMRQDTDQYSRTPNPQPQGMRKRKGTNARGAQKITVRSQGCAILSPSCQKRMRYRATVRSKPPAIWPISTADGPICATVVPIRMSPSRPSAKRVQRPHLPTSRPTAKPRFSVFDNIAIDLHSPGSRTGMQEGCSDVQVSMPFHQVQATRPERSGNALSSPPVPGTCMRRSRSHAQHQTKYTLSPRGESQEADYTALWYGSDANNCTRADAAGRAGVPAHAAWNSRIR